MRRVSLNLESRPTVDDLGGPWLGTAASKSSNVRAWSPPLDRRDHP